MGGLHMVVMAGTFLVAGLPDRGVLNDEAGEEEGLLVPSSHGGCRPKPGAENAIFGQAFGALGFLRCHWFCFFPFGGG